MDTDFSTVLVGWVFSVIAMIGGIIARDRYMTASVATGDKAVRDEMDKKINILHQRVNNTRDEFVRRDDLENHLSHIERVVESMHEEQKATNARIDGFMAELIKLKS